jgi:hypothetical protein
MLTLVPGIGQMRREHRGWLSCRFSLAAWSWAW